MRFSKKIFTSFVALILALPVFAQQAGTAAVLWRDRGDVAALNLLDGPGGKARAPGTELQIHRGIQERDCAQVRCRR